MPLREDTKLTPPSCDRTCRNFDDSIQVDWGAASWEGPLTPPPSLKLA